MAGAIAYRGMSVANSPVALRRRLPLVCGFRFGGTGSVHHFIYGVVKMCLSIASTRPDEVISQGKYRNIKWVVVHNGTGYRCGYCRVPPGHPWHGADCDQAGPEVHGGVTFAQADIDCGNEQDGGGWWLGFDCAHAGDAPDPKLPGGSLTVSTALRLGYTPGVVRSTEYVEQQCYSLIDQIIERAPS